MKRLSVIIPMFNVEGFVERCIRSLTAQDINPEDYEIICINDGSPDRSKEIITVLKNEFNNIILIDQENQGVSVARNRGIEVAKGEYLMMIDPDDFLKENSLYEVLEYAEVNKLHILYLGFEILDSTECTVHITDFAGSHGKVYDGVDSYFVERRPNSKDSDRSWAILFQNELLRKYRLLYPRGVPYLEDGLFMVKVSSVAERVSYYNKPIYQRTTRPGSATNSDLFTSQRAIDGFHRAIDDLRSHSNAFSFNTRQSMLINHGIANFVLLSLFPLTRPRFLRRFVRSVQRLRMSGYSSLETTGVVEPYLFYARLYNTSPYIFLIYYLKDLILIRFKAMIDR